jgi:DNA-binding SARP family transcriptional activator
VLEARLFGKPAFVLGGQEIGLPTKKALALLAFVALEGESPRSRLSSLLWGGLPEEDARRNLRQELYRLSKTALGVHLSQGEAVRLEGFESDVARFRQALEVLDERGALEHWRGTFLDGLEVRDAAEFDEWLNATRERLLAERHWALEGLATKLERSGELRAALNARLELLRHNELQESHHREAMRLHALLGEREAALERFHRCRKVLHDELGLEPLPATVELAEQIKATSAPAISLSTPEAALGSPLLIPPLVGRERAWAQMEAAWDAGQMIVVAGEPGVGKTRLIETFAQSKGAFLKTEGRPEDLGVPFATLTRSIRAIFRLYPEMHIDTPDWVIQECSRLVPELRGPDAEPLIAGHRLRLFDAWHDLLLGLSRSQQLSCFVSDDAQFFDAASFEMGVHGFRRFFSEAGHGLEMPRVIAGFRTGELQSHISKTIDDLARSGRVTVIELEPLSEADVLNVISAMSGHSGGRLFSRRLHRATNGNPMFILETVRNLFEQGELHTDETGWSTPYDLETEDYLELPIPQSVREVVTSRVERLGAAPQRALEAASVLGSDFGLELLIEATALSEWELVEALERAQSANVIHPTPQGHRFTHDLIQRSLEDGLSGERRKLIHRKLASALQNTDGEPARIADHLERGGKSKEAVAHRVRAAEAAARAYANEAALEQYAKALGDGADARTAFSIHAARAALYKALDDRTGWGEAVNAQAEIATAERDPDLALDADLALAEHQFYSGQYLKALEHAERALARPEIPPEKLARAHLEAGNPLMRLGRLQEAAVHFQHGLEIVPTGTFSLIGRLNHSLSVCMIERNNLEVVQQYNHVALAAFAAAGDRMGTVLAHNTASQIALLEGERSTAQTHLEYALSVARETGQAIWQRMVLLNIAKLHLDDEQVEAAWPYLHQGLELTRNPQDPYMETAFLSYLNWAHTLRGEFTQALEYANDAIRRADQFGIFQLRVTERIALAGLHLELGDLSAARDLLEVAQTILQPDQTDSVSLLLEVNIARCEFEEGHVEEALERLNQVVASGGPAEPEERARAQCVLGQAHLEAGHFEAAATTVAGLEHPTSVLALALAVRLRAGLALKRINPQDVDQACACLNTDRLPPLEAQMLRGALAAVLEPERARIFRTEGREQAYKLAFNLEARLRESFLKRQARIICW